MGAGRGLVRGCRVEISRILRAVVRFVRGDTLRRVDMADLQYGDSNFAGAETGLFAQRDVDDADFGGDRILTVQPKADPGDDDSDKPARRLDGIFAEGNLGGSAVVGISDAGLAKGELGALTDEALVGVLGMSDGGFESEGFFVGVLGVSEALGGIGVFGHGRSSGVKAESFDGAAVAADALPVPVGDPQAAPVAAGVRCSGLTGVVAVGVANKAADSDLFNGTGVFAFGENIGVVGRGDPLAGLFSGNVVVVGDLVVHGRKSAAVPHSVGGYRRLYSVESPESWFEDFGEARLKGGRATVRVDRDFAAVVKKGAYHVFLTPYGDSSGLFVARRTATLFEVREHGRGHSNVKFSYRIAAKRKDVKPERFGEAALPKGMDAALKTARRTMMASLDAAAKRRSPARRTSKKPSRSAPKN
jgi:hypothetical protein